MPRYYRRYRRREGRPEKDNSTLESLSELEEVNESTCDSLKFDDIWDEQQTSCIMWWDQP